MWQRRMRLLAAGVFLLLWPVNVPAESGWLTLLTGCLGAGLLLAALWGLRRVNPSFSLSLGLCAGAALLEAGTVCAGLLGRPDAGLLLGAGGSLLTVALLAALARGLAPFLEGSRLRPWTAALWYLLGAGALMIVWMSGAQSVSAAAGLAMAGAVVIAAVKIARAALWAGEELPSSSVRLCRGGWAAGAAGLAVLLSAVLAAVAAGNRPPARMTAAAVPQAGETEELRQAGMPEELLADLSREELERCRGVLSCQSWQEDVELDGGCVRLTLAVASLPENRLRAYAHYRWLREPHCRGRDALGIVRFDDMTPAGDGNVSVRHLARVDGQEVELVLSEHTAGLLPAAALPAQGEERRGYCAADYLDTAGDYFCTSLYVQLVHQQEFLNYPFLEPLDLLEGGVAYGDEKGAFARRYAGMLVDLA